MANQQCTPLRRMDIVKKEIDNEAVSVDIIHKWIKQAFRELKVLDWHIRMAQARQIKAKKRFGTLWGEPLGEAFDEVTRANRCAVCREKFRSNGWYRLGSCGHEYHLQCLLLHASEERRCVRCETEIPFEFYLSFDMEKNMPKF